MAPDYGHVDVTFEEDNETGGDRKGQPMFIGWETVSEQKIGCKPCFKLVSDPVGSRQWSKICNFCDLAVVFRTFWPYWCFGDQNTGLKREMGSK